MSNVTTAELSAISALTSEIQRALTLSQQPESQMPSPAITQAMRAEAHHQHRTLHYRAQELAYFQRIPQVQPTVDFTALGLAAAAQQRRLSSSDLLPHITAANRAAFVDGNGDVNLATHSYPRTPPRLHPGMCGADGAYEFPRTLSPGEVVAEIARRRAAYPGRDLRRGGLVVARAMPGYVECQLELEQERQRQSRDAAVEKIRPNTIVSSDKTKSRAVRRPGSFAVVRTRHGNVLVEGARPLASNAGHFGSQDVGKPRKVRRPSKNRYYGRRISRDEPKRSEHTGCDEAGMDGDDCIMSGMDC